MYTITGRKSAGTYIEYYVTPNPKSTGFRTNGSRSITTTYDATTTNTETEEYEDSGATASDNYDGDITNDIVTVNNVNRATFGTYTVTYNVSDSSGNNADQKTILYFDETSKKLLGWRQHESLNDFIEIKIINHKKFKTDNKKLLNEIFKLTESKSNIGMQYYGPYNGRKVKKLLGGGKLN